MVIKSGRGPRVKKQKNKKHMQNHPMLFSHINKGAMKVASLCCNCTRDIKR